MALTTGKALRALMVEDSEHDAEILALQLRKGGYDVQYERVDSEAAMRASLPRPDIDIVFCDYMIPGFGAQPAFDLLRQTRPDLPFIVVSALVDEDGAADLLVAGADDFIAKGRYARLIPTVRRALGTAEERRARERLQVQLELQAQRDALTGLLTRAALIEHMRQMLAEEAATLELFRLDINGFSRVNETFGHEAGDELLRGIAERLRAALPEAAVVARIASDEFGVVVREAQGPGLTEKLIGALDRAFVVGAHAVHITASVGSALAPQHGSDAAALMQRAGTAVERAKRLGIPAAQFSPEDDLAAVGLGEIEEFRSALERGELVLHYQPQVEGAELRPAGVEALIRWSHPSRGLLPPSAFLAAAREGGFGRLVTRWVLEEAIAQCHAWWSAGSEVQVAVNLTMEDAQDPALTDRVADLLARHELPARALELELTEDTAITDPAAVERTVRGLNALGARIAIDDFGTGYATLTYLQRLPVYRLKIDSSFVQGMASLPANVAIVRSAIELGHQLGLVTLAEGVEDDATWLRLRELGCDGGQGYAFARPMAFRELGRWLRARVPEAAPGAQREHAERWLAFAEAGGTHGAGVERIGARLQEVEQARHELDLALDGATERGDADTALRLGTALRFVWIAHGRLADGIDALTRALALPHAQGPTPVRAAALNALGMLFGQQEDFARGRPLLAEASAIQRRLGDRGALANTLNNLALVLGSLGDVEAAKDVYLESLTLWRAQGDSAGEALALGNLAANAYRRRDLSTARAYAQRAFELYRARADDSGVAVTLDTLAAIALEKNELAEALRSYQASLSVYRDLGVKGDATQPMAGIAMIAAQAGDPERALILAGAIAGLRDRYSSLPPINGARYELCLSELERSVGAAGRARALVEGRALTWDQAISLALGLTIAPASTAPAATQRSP